MIAESEAPLLGYIAAGRPIEALGNQEGIEVPPSLRTNNPCYVLRIKGNSIIEDGILDGDLVVIEMRDQTCDGEIVVAFIDGSDATLKRICNVRAKWCCIPPTAPLSPFPTHRIE